MQLLIKYFELQKQIHDYFGYAEDWKVIPMDDSTNYYWSLHQEENGSGEVHFNEEKFSYEDEPYYSNVIYTQRHLKKWVFRGPDYTMVCVDTQTDGNKFLQIFDNKKEIKPS